MGKRGRFHFAIGSPSGPQSTPRCLVTHRNEVYISSPGTVGRVKKLSFHASGICRDAFTREIGRPVTLPDRAMTKWKRNPTPPPGSTTASAVLTITIPTDYLSTATRPPGRPITWVKPAPAGGATVLDLFFSMESHQRIEELFAEHGDRHVLRYVRLPRGDSVVLAWSHVPQFENRDLKVPRRDGGSELLFPARDRHKTGRPVRMEFYPRVADGDRMFLMELGGHAMPPGSAYRPAPGPAMIRE